MSVEVIPATVIYRFGGLLNGVSVANAPMMSLLKLLPFASGCAIFLIDDIGGLMAVMFAVSVVGYFVGAILENVRLVLVAFIINLVTGIHAVIDTLGAYFHLDFFRDQHPATMSDNDILFNGLFVFVLDLIFIYVNYAYYNELHGSGDD